MPFCQMFFFCRRFLDFRPKGGTKKMHQKGPAQHVFLKHKTTNWPNPKLTACRKYLFLLNYYNLYIVCKNNDFKYKSLVDTLS